MLIPNWRRAWRFLSVQIPAAALTAWGIWAAVPEDQQRLVIDLVGLDPARWMPLLGLVGTIAGRLVAQPAIHKDASA
jgi:hypothetical protein